MSGPVENRDVVQELVGKWSPVIPGGLPNDIRRATALLVENQDHYFNGLEPEVMAKVVATFGARQDIYVALAHAFARSPLHWMVSMQPLTAPVGKVAYYSPKFLGQSSGGIPGVQLNIETKDVETHTRNTGWKTGSAHSMFCDAMDQLAREVAGSCFDGSKPADVQFDLTDTDQAIVIRLATAAQLVHRKSMRAPSNWIMLSPENVKLLEHEGEIEPSIKGFGLLQQLAEQFHYGDVHKVRLIGTYKNRWRVITDPLFPLNRILTGYTGTSILDTGYVSSPFVFTFTPDGNQVHPWWRGAGSLVRPEFYSTVGINK